MTRSTATKLTVFIFLAFIVCLPEFFPSDTEIQIQFFCLPFDPCDTTSGHAPNGEGQDCDETPVVSQNEGGAKPLCKEEAKNTTNQDELVKDWFVCETQTDLQSLHDNTSLSGVDVEIVLDLQTTKLSLQNVTARGRLNWSGLHGSFQNVTLIHCCGRPENKSHTLPTGPSRPNASQPVVPSKPLPSSAEPSSALSPGQTDSALNLTRRLHVSQCFLHYPATAVSRTPAKKGYWWCITATVWLVLVFIVVIVVLISFGVQVYTKRSCSHKQTVSVPSTVSQPRKLCKQKSKSLGDLPDFFHTEDELLFVEETLAEHSRGLFPIIETSGDEGEGEDVSDSTMTEEGSKESLDMGQTPAHTHSDYLTYLHHRGNLFSYDKDGGM
ncbi:uncharacterized protein si:dkey-192k22.2 isoform X1 [Electrophorus electricus]|uniref:uncharacterized protein si:dkey-192k22.2 isoform X1 n=1 Tax=Electrophorus electricus TaxID=8005 RepID=UPI0015D0AA0E|nr:uncharacterized protein si:dkey-192k22.2 isoform X1 [Electrophorus electricus]